MKRFHITQSGDATHIGEFDTIHEVGQAARYWSLPMIGHEVYMVWENGGFNVDTLAGEIVSYTLAGIICGGRLFLEPSQTGESKAE